MNEYSDEVSETRRIGRGSIILIVSRIINLALSLAVVMMITRLLDPENFGIYSFVMSIAAILLTVPNLIDIGMIRYSTHYLVLNEKAKAKDVFTKSIKLLVVIMLASILLTIAISSQLSSFEYILSIIPFVFFSALSYLILIIFFYLRNTTISVLEGILKNALLIIFAPILIGLLGLYGSFIAYDIAAITTFFVMYAFLHILFLRKIKRGHAEENVNDIFKFTAPNFLSGFLNNMTQRAGVFILTYFAISYGMKEVGYYNLALTIILSIGSLFSAIPEASMPAILKFKTLEKKELIQETIDASLKYSLILIVPLILVLSNIAEPLVTLFFKGEYIRVGLNIKILGFFLLLLLIKKHFVTVIIAYNYVKYLLYAEIISFAVFIAAAGILIPVYASRGAGIALVLGTAASAAVYIWKVNTIGIKFPLHHTLNILGAGAIFLSLGFVGGGLLPVIAVSTLLGLIYFLLLYLIRELDTTDYDRLRSLI